MYNFAQLRHHARNIDYKHLTSFQNLVIAEMVGSLGVIIGFQKLQNFWVAKAFMSSYMSSLSF